MITLEQAKNLTTGQIVYHHTNTNSDGTKQRWRVTSVKTWKRNLSKVEVGLKNGLYNYDKLTQNDLHLIDLTE